MDSNYLIGQHSFEVCDYKVCIWDNSGESRCDYIEENTTFIIKEEDHHAVLYVYFKTEDPDLMVHGYYKFPGVCSATENNILVPGSAGHRPLEGFSDEYLNLGAYFVINPNYSNDWCDPYEPSKTWSEGVFFLQIWIMNPEDCGGTYKLPVNIFYNNMDNKIFSTNFTVKFEGDPCPEEERKEKKENDREKTLDVKVLINHGSEKTTERRVLLTIISDNAKQMRLRNDGGDWTYWQLYSSRVDWNLRDEEGNRAVFVQTKDEDGNLGKGYDSVAYEKYKIVDIRKHFNLILILLTICVFSYTMYIGMPKGSDKKVDTSRVALLGFSLISMIIIFFLTFYLVLYSTMDYQKLLPGLEILPGLYLNDISAIEATKTFFMLMFILPLILSFILWYVMPPFIKYWYSLEFLPDECGYLYGLVRKIALRMRIPPPDILYTQKNIANCFNIGKKENESTLVISKWLLQHLDSEELKAVLAHEMAHTKNGDVNLMAYFNAIKQVIPFSLLLAFCGYLYYYYSFSSSPITLLYISRSWVFIIPFLILYLFLFLGIQWFSRLREATADARASLIVQKDILKKVLYKLACAKSPHMIFVPSSLMTSSNHRFGSIFSTHPSIFNRHETINKNKYIIDHKNSPSSKFCFISALSIFMFLALFNSIIQPLFILAVGYLPMGGVTNFFDPIIVAALLILYYDHLSWKYLGMIILLTISLLLIISLGFFLPLFLAMRNSVLPAIELFPSKERIILFFDPSLFGNLSTLIILLEETIMFLIISFFLTVFFKHIKKHMNANGILDENITLRETSELSRHEKKKMFFESLTKELDEMKKDKLY